MMVHIQIKKDDGTVVAEYTGRAEDTHDYTFLPPVRAEHGRAFLGYTYKPMVSDTPDSVSEAARRGFYEG